MQKESNTTWAGLHKVRSYTYFITEESEEITAVPYIEMDTNHRCKRSGSEPDVLITIERILGPFLDEDPFCRFLLYLFAFFFICLCSSFLIIDSRCACACKWILTLLYAEKYIRVYHRKKQACKST